MDVLHFQWNCSSQSEHEFFSILFLAVAATATATVAVSRVTECIHRKVPPSKARFVSVCVSVFESVCLAPWHYDG